MTVETRVFGSDVKGVLPLTCHAQEKTYGTEGRIGKKEQSGAPANNVRTRGAELAKTSKGMGTSTGKGIEDPQWRSVRHDPISPDRLCKRDQVNQTPNKKRMGRSEQSTPAKKTRTETQSSGQSFLTKLGTVHELGAEMPRFGRMLNGCVYQDTRELFQRMPERKPLEMTVKQLCKRDLKNLGKFIGRCKMLPEGSRITIAWLGTIRKCSATHTAPLVLTKRAAREFATALKFSEKYQHYARQKKFAPRTTPSVLNPLCGEIACDLPPGWTSTSKLHRDNVPEVATQSGARVPMVCVCRGVGGMALSTRHGYRKITYIEKDAACQEVLQARIEDGSLDKAPVHGDLHDVHVHQLPEVPQALEMGFPCTNICVAGKKEGFDNDEANGSKLFFEGVRLVDECGPKLREVYLENVQHILKLPRVWKIVLKELHKRKFDAAWCVVTATQCGLPQKRARWFLRAWRDDAPVPAHFKVDLTRAFFDECAESVEPELPPVDQWLLPRAAYAANRARLEMIGNVCIPSQAELAWKICCSL